jgi:stage V sporulation protein SpoVS
MASSSIASTASSRTWLRTTVILVIAAVAAIAVNYAVAAVAISGGAPAHYGPLTIPAYVSFTIVGVVAGWVGWSLALRRAHDPRRVLTVLVPVVALASFVPDVVLLVFGFIPGTTVGAVVALMVMHLVVLAFAVPAYVIASPREALRRHPRA